MMIIQLIVVAAATTASPQAISGVAVAGDGDSLRIGETRIRLFGIDAPELNQMCIRGSQTWACGKESADQLATLVTGREVRCLPVGVDAYERTLARCSLRGVDVNRAMVARGYAMAFGRYSTEYVSTEASAKAGKRGLWSGTFAMPSEVRAQIAPPAPSGRPAKQVSRRTASSSKLPAPSACNIKGNHSRRGDWIYHLPGMPYYDQTRPEAVFCTEAEARAAGYRRALVR